MDKRPLVGLAGVLVATMIADLNLSVVTASLPDIRGGLAISADPGTWLQSLYITGEALGMGLAPWLAITFTLRRFMLFVIIFGGLTALAIPTTSSLPVLYTLQLLLGLSGGLTIPLLIMTAFRVLDPPIRLYGLAAYALTATCFPYLSESLAALWTSGPGWQFVFIESVPFSVIAAGLVWYGIKPESPRYDRFASFDWSGAVLIVIGLGALTTMLMQGNRLDWFNSKAICVLALASGVAIPLLLINEWFHETPLIKIQLFARRNFAYGGIALITFLIISQSAATLPDQYLTKVQNYRPIQAYPITLEIAAAQLIMLPLLAIILNYKQVDGRWISLAGLACILAACIGCSFITAAWTRDQFYLWQGLQAIGQPMVVMPLLLMSTNSVVPAEGPFASALINLPRSIAEALSSWLLQLIKQWRGAYHSQQLIDQIGRNRFRTIQSSGNTPRFPPPLLANGSPRTPDSLADLAAMIKQQVTVLTLSDSFLVMGALVVALAIVLILLTQRTYPPVIVFAKE